MSDFDPTKIPAEMPPPGETIDFTGGPSQAWMPRLAIYTTLPVAVAFLVLRIYTRLRAKVRLGVDDYLAMASIAVSGGFCGLLLVNVKDDLYGRHAWNIPFSAVTATFMQETLAITALYCWVAALVKLSLCAFFLRIFSPSLYSRIMIWAGIILVIASYIAFFVAVIVCSVPLAGDQGWMDYAFVNRSAQKTMKLSIGLGVLGTFTDFYIIAIPLTAVSGLKMTVTKKIGVSALFATGLLACSFSAASLAKRLDTYRARFIYKHSDPFWLSMVAYAFAVAEINLGIICASVPITFPIFKGLAGKASISWDSWKHYRSRTRIPSLTQKGSTEFSNDASATQRELPKVPKGTLHTLLSFVRGSQNSQRGEKSQGITVTKDTDIEMSPRSELHSLEAGAIVPPALNRQ